MRGELVLGAAVFLGVAILFVVAWGRSDDSRAAAVPTAVPTVIPTPDTSHTRYAFAKATVMIPSEAEWTSASASTSTTDLITMPTWAGNEYVYLAIRLDRHDLTFLAACLRCPNVISTYQKLATRTLIRGTEYKVWRSQRQLRGSVVSDVQYYMR